MMPFPPDASTRRRLLQRRLGEVPALAPGKATRPRDEGHQRDNPQQNVPDTQRVDEHASDGRAQGDRHRAHADLIEPSPPSLTRSESIEERVRVIDRMQGTGPNEVLEAVEDLSVLESDAIDDRVLDPLGSIDLAEPCLQRF